MSQPPGYQYPPPPVAAERPKRRWWLIAIVVAWALALAGFAAWSVRHDPPTVAEQRDIAEALPVLERATGDVFAAADAPGRVVTLGPLEFDRTCALTPVWDGVEAGRDVTVRVRAGEAPAALEAIARAMPADYDAAVRRNTARTRYALRADAGEFVGVDAAADSDATILTLRVSTGCRPTAKGVDLEPSPPAAVETPPAFGAALKAIGVSGAGATAAEVACPGGGTARTVTADGPAAPADLGRALRSVIGGADVVQAEPHALAYRDGAVSVVVVDGDGTARVTATTGCR
ncbi:hypothetical protein ACIBSW_05360 [Actinoplanes sp. NPDC049668]|uniref:hypothetical protein n=1 Tax=unclassified Actinoplanes TaxID=2626549 RepID=UPI00339E3EDA